MRPRPAALSLILAGVVSSGTGTHAVQAQASAAGPTAPRAAQPSADKTTPAQVKAAVGLLGSFDFPVRMQAGRTVRRSDASVAVPILIDTVSNQGADWYVRFRALVLLSGFNDPRTAQVMASVLADKNDRLRAVAYGWFERHPEPGLVPRLLAALDREDTEFVRPALTRALAAHGTDATVRQTMAGLVMKGQDIFRAAAIEVLGEYRAAYALQPIIDVSRLDGPLQDDAILAIGRIGDTRGHATLAELQQKSPRNLQPWIAASLCLLGSNCASHSRYLLDTLSFAITNPGYQELLRAAAGGLAALAVAGNAEAATALFERGAPTRDPERAAIALALGTIALRNTPLVLQVLEKQRDLQAPTELLREAFDMLEEDFEEERFFVSVRRAYWAAAAGSPGRRVAETLIQRLEF